MTIRYAKRQLSPDTMTAVTIRGDAAAPRPYEACIMLIRRGPKVRAAKALSVASTAPAASPPMTTLPRNSHSVVLAAEPPSAAAERNVPIARSRPTPMRLTMYEARLVEISPATTPTGGTRPAALRGCPNDSRIDGQTTPSMEGGSAMLTKAR